MSIFEEYGAFKALLMSTNSICFRAEIRKIFICILPFILGTVDSHYLEVQGNTLRYP